MSESKSFTSPVGRFIGGSVSKVREKKDQRGQVILKDGKPQFVCDFGVAFPKNGTTHWSQLGEFGKTVWDTGHAAFPGGQAQRPDFSWKATDGDSAIPNKKGKRPCDQEGYVGHWVFWFSSSFLPKTYDATGSNLVPAESIRPGHYIQVAGSVRGNTGDSPGIYLNHNMVAHSGFGPEITFGPDVAAAGFGVGVQLPPGASSMPVAALAVPSAVAAPSVAAMPTAVRPHTSILSVPGTLPHPPAPVAASPVMTAKAAGTSYAAFINAGWQDAQLREQGYIL